MTSRIYEIKLYADRLTNQRRLAWLRSKAQANFRNEKWELTFAEFCRFWNTQERWEQRGRGVEDLTLTRFCEKLPWSTDNCVIIKRMQLLRLKTHLRGNSEIDRTPYFQGGIYYGQ